MAPYDEEQTFRDMSLKLRNLWHLDRHGRKVTPAKRDKDGFKIRRPKLGTAISLGVAAVLSAIAGVIIKRRNRD